MYNKFVILPYGPSNSARALSQKLSPLCRRVRPNGDYKYYGNHLPINWGSSTVPSWGTTQALAAMLNKPAAVANASEKVRTFQVLAQVMPDKLPHWTTGQHVAREWLNGSGKYAGGKHAVVCRTLTRANSGRGIVLAGSAEELVLAPLYTLYKPKTAEYRIHVFSRFGVIDSVQKRRRTGAADATGIEKYVRSWDNGWVFCRDGIQVPESVRNAAEEAVAALGLDFGAVDIGYHPEFGVAIYEVNTAPGIEGTTLESYASTFRRFL